METTKNTPLYHPKFPKNVLGMQGRIPAIRRDLPLVGATRSQLEGNTLLSRPWLIRDGVAGLVYHIQHM